MKKNSSKIICFIAIACLLLGLCACGAPQQTDSNNAAEPQHEQSAQEPSLADFDGWWRRPDDYESPGLSLVDFFRIDAAEGIWTIYNSLGVAQYTEPAYFENGELVLVFELGDVYFTPDGTDTLTDGETGDVHFVRGEALQEPDYSVYAGKWYVKGELDHIYYLIDGDRFELYYNYEDDTEPYASGSCNVKPTTIILSDGWEMEVITLELLRDEYMFGDDFNLTSDNLVLIGDMPGGSQTFYVHESAIGNGLADDSIMQAKLILGEWRYYDEDGSFGSLNFDYPNYCGLVAYPPTGGQGERIRLGEWTVSGDTIALTTVDGGEDNFIIGEDMKTITRSSDGKVYYDSPFDAERAVMGEEEWTYPIRFEQYLLDGDEDSQAIQFYDMTSIAYVYDWDTEDYAYGGYSLEGDRISVTLDDGTQMGFTILDTNMIESDTGEVYIYTPDDET